MPEIDELHAIITTNVFGNAYHDAELMQRIHEFAMNDAYSIASRATVLRFLSFNVMGCDNDPNETDDDAIRSYVEFIS